MKKVIKYLPNPDVPRKIIDDAYLNGMCKGCNKIFNIYAEINKSVCEAYYDPDIWGRFGKCPMNRKEEKASKKKLNPIKFSRRNR